MNGPRKAKADADGTDATSLHEMKKIKEGTDILMDALTKKEYIGKNELGNRFYRDSITRSATETMRQYRENGNIIGGECYLVEFPDGRTEYACYDPKGRVIAHFRGLADIDNLDFALAMESMAMSERNDVVNMAKERKGMKKGRREFPTHHHGSGKE